MNKGKRNLERRKGTNQKRRRKNPTSDNYTNNQVAKEKVQIRKVAETDHILVLIFHYFSFFFGTVQVISVEKKYY